MVVNDFHVLGHESAGVVVELGPRVTKFKVGLIFLLLVLTGGDRVAIEPGVPCSKPTCYFCRTGRYRACPDMAFKSTPPYDGTMRRYLVHPEAWLHHLPDNISFEEGALLEPLSVALAAADQAKLSVGMPTLICGAGPIGLVNVLCAARAGCEPLVITDLDPFRLRFAKFLVPTVHTVLVGINDRPQEVAEKIKQFGGPEGIQRAFECTGFEHSVSTAIHVSHPFLHPLTSF
jgi:L-iditol 2-dehydrogenase